MTAQAKNHTTATDFKAGAVILDWLMTPEVRVILKRERWYFTVYVGFKGKRVESNPAFPVSFEAGDFGFTHTWDYPADYTIGQAVDDIYFDLSLMGIRPIGADHA